MLAGRIKLHTQLEGQSVSTSPLRGTDQSPRYRAANAGATVAELEAIFGWSGGSMAALYTRAADRRRLARGAMHKLANDK